MKKVFRVMEIINGAAAAIGIFCLCNLNDNVDDLFRSAILLLAMTIVCGLLAAFFDYLQRVEITLPDSVCIVLYLIQRPFTHTRRSR